MAAEYLVNGNIAKYIVAALVVSVVVFVIFSSLVSSLTSSLKKPKPSFISLDQGDENRKKEKMKQYEKRWSRLFTAVFLNIGVAILMLFVEERLQPLAQRFWGWF